MLFPTLDFLLFFLVVAAMLAALDRHFAMKKAMLVGASYFFYAQWDWRFCFLLAGSTAISFVAGLLIGASRDSRRRRLVLTVAVALHLVILGIFKYLDFLVLSANQLAHMLGLQHELPFFEVLLPVGISFFTFHGISYITDVYREDVAVCRAPLDMALYMSFFPQLVAGPIVRAAYFLPQLARPADEPIPVAAALMLILGGMVKKVIIANYLATGLVDPVFAAPENYGGPDLLLATYAYAVQIYCDFSAYTDIAIAVAALCGFRFPRNFNQPYRSVRLREFWQRWHMSLSFWLRDYLLQAAGRQSPRPAQDLPQSDDHDAARRHLARRGVEIRDVGRAARRRAGDRAHGPTVARPAADKPRRQDRIVADRLSPRLPRLDLFPGGGFHGRQCIHPRSRQRLDRAGAAGAAGDGRADRDRHGRPVPASGIV